MKIIKFTVAMATAIGLISCSESVELIGTDSLQIEITDDVRYVHSFFVTSRDFVSDGITRSSLVLNEGVLDFSWTEGDTIGVFPIGGYQVDFPISDGVGTKTALFDGGQWALRAEALYAGYFPFSTVFFTANPMALPVDYSGQILDGSAPFSNLGKYDYQVAPATATTDEGTVDLQLQHLGAVEQIRLVLPAEGSYTHLSLSCLDAQFSTQGTFDITSDAPVIVPMHHGSMEFDLCNVTAAAEGDEVLLYFITAPVDQTGSVVNALLTDSEGNEYTATYNGKAMNAGTLIARKATFTPVEVVAGSKAGLLDGAAFNTAIRQLVGNAETLRRIVFCQSAKNSSTIVSADDSDYMLHAEFVEASGIVTIMTSAENLQLPADCSGMFAGFSNLEQIDFSAFSGHVHTAAVTTMNAMFDGDANLSVLDLLGFDTGNVTDMAKMFRNCSSLTKLTLGDTFSMDALIYDPANSQFGKSAMCEGMASQSMSCTIECKKGIKNQLLSEDGQSNSANLATAYILWNLLDGTDEASVGASIDEIPTFE